MTTVTGEVSRCETCPYVSEIYGSIYCDYEAVIQEGISGNPEKRKGGESIPHDCPLLQNQVLVKLESIYPDRNETI